MPDHASIVGLLTSIRERPGMYLGEPSILRLRMFLMGYHHAVFSFNIESDDWELEGAFQRWVEKRFATRLTIGWDAIIRSAVGSDREAFDLFWVLWDEFIALGENR